MFELLIFLATLNSPPDLPVELKKSPCERLPALMPKMSLERKLELSTGCSKVNGVQVMSDYRIDSVLKQYEGDNGN